MEVSFILSENELLTLISVNTGITEAGQHFVDAALAGAELCDLLTLVEKNLAKSIDDELELEPVLRMVADALAHADSAEINDEVWTIRSPFITLKCQQYPYHDGHWMITPVKE